MVPCFCTPPSEPFPMPHPHLPTPILSQVTVHNSPMAAALAAEIAPPSTTTALDYER